MTIQFSDAAHNLARWVSRIGLADSLVTTGSLRRQFFSMPGRLVRSARRQRVRLPQDWPWRKHFIGALDRLRKIPPPILA